MSLKCMNCGVSVFNKPLQRVNPKGEDGIFWCEPCIAKEEPELARNIDEDKSQIEKDLEEICYQNKKR